MAESDFFELQQGRSLTDLTVSEDVDEVASLILVTIRLMEVDEVSPPSLEQLF